MEEQKTQETERNREAILLLKTDMNCRLMVNSDNHGALQKNTPLSITLPLGSHLINVITQDGLLEKEWTQDLNNEEQVVYLIQLAEEYAQLQAKREEEVGKPLGIECWSADQIQQEQMAAATEVGLTKVFRDGPDAPEMVVIPAGSYRRGEAFNKYKVTITRPFAIGKYPVTVAEWKYYVEKGEISYSPS
ncbi:MAG: SUMF1/EgtB/PvdO family nonheme iron enzyme, partial [Candidatus Nitrotoga sp.]